MNQTVETQSNFNLNWGDVIEEEADSEQKKHPESFGELFGVQNVYT